MALSATIAVIRQMTIAVLRIDIVSLEVSIDGGECVGDFRTPAEGEVIFTELQVAPGAGLDPSRAQWLELYNTTGDNLSLHECILAGNAGDTITIQDGLTYAQALTTSVVYDIDNVIAEAIGQYQVAIPPSADRVRIIYNNNHDIDGSSVFTRSRITKVTGV